MPVGGRLVGFRCLFGLAGASLRSATLELPSALYWLFRLGS